MNSSENTVIITKQTVFPNGGLLENREPSLTTNIPKALNPLSTLFFGFLVSLFLGIVLVEVARILTGFNQFRVPLMVITGIGFFWSGIRHVPTFHHGVILQAGHRLQQFVLLEGTHWLVPGLYKIKIVEIRKEILEIREFTVITNGTAENPREKFVELKIHASIQWEVGNPGKFLEIERSILDNSLRNTVIDTIRGVAIQEGQNYYTLIQNWSIGTRDRAVQLVQGKANRWGIQINDITVAGITQTGR